MAEKDDKDIKKGKKPVKKNNSAKKKDVKTNKQEQVKDQSTDSSQRPPVQLNFHSYLIMLGAIGWQFLGKIPNPQTGKVVKNLMQVKEIIDLMSILEEKTKGNLTEEEDHVLKSTLSNLRLNYVNEIKK